MCNIKIEENEYSLCNIYAPNEDDPGYFKSVFKTISKFGVKNVVVGGDFNLTLQPSLDRLDSEYNNHKAKETLIQCMDNMALSDIWRVRNPTVKNILGSKEAL